MNMHLNIELDKYDFLRLSIKKIPQEFIDKYNLLDIVTPDGWIYSEISKAVYSLPQAGALAHANLKKVLEPHGYAPITYTPGLWRHRSQPIASALVVDNFGVKYVGK